METVRDFNLGGSKITADGDCKHKTKRCFLLGRKGMTDLDNILKSRDITLLTKVCMSKWWFFPVVMYGLGSWTIKKAKHWRIGACKLWHWRRLLRLPWTATKPINPKGNQHWIFFRSTDAEAETPVFWPPDTKSQLLRKDLKRGSVEGRKRRASTQWTWVWTNSERRWRTGKPGVLQSMGLQSSTILSNWTTNHSWGHHQ